jgi:hypothetical protein
MADNVAITAGTGTSIATDDAGAGGHCQIIKLAISTDGSATLIPADTANGIDVDVTRAPVRAATTDAITAKIATDAIQNGLTALTPKFAFANVAASATDSSIVSAVASKKLRVLAAYAVAGDTTGSDLTFNTKPAGAGSAITALFNNAANGGEVLPFSPVGWFETVAGEGLTVTTGAGSTTGIGVVYIEVCGWLLRLTRRRSLPPRWGTFPRRTRLLVLRRA